MCTAAVRYVPNADTPDVNANLWFAVTATVSHNLTYAALQCVHADLGQHQRRHSILAAQV
jgi:hypothetical protein